MRAHRRRSSTTVSVPLWRVTLALFRFVYLLRTPPRIFPTRSSLDSIAEEQTYLVARLSIAPPSEFLLFFFFLIFFFFSFEERTRFVVIVVDRWLLTECISRDLSVGRPENSSRWRSSLRTRRGGAMHSSTSLYRNNHWDSCIFFMFFFFFFLSFSSFRYFPSRSRFFSPSYLLPIFHFPLSVERRKTRFN